MKALNKSLRTHLDVLLLEFYSNVDDDDNKHVDWEEFMLYLESYVKEHLEDFNTILNGLEISGVYAATLESLTFGNMSVHDVHLDVLTLLSHVMKIRHKLVVTNIQNKLNSLQTLLQQETTRTPVMDSTINMVPLLISTLDQL